MNVLVAKSAGFCWGVRRAVRKARELASETNLTVYTDGPLIHNRQMMEQLRSDGVVEASDPRSLSEGILLVRAHGIPPDRRARLESLPLRLEDATCPDVARIQASIRRFASRGHHILIFGDPGHAEVVGLQGYAGERGRVVSRPEDLDALPDLDPVCLVSQSTQLPLAYRQMADAVTRRFPSAEIVDTICRSTKNRQRDLIELAGRVDGLVVVGDAHSANTLRLVELARSLKPTVHIETADALRADTFHGMNTVGITAGASTPAFVIEQVAKALEAMPPNGRLA